MTDVLVSFAMSVSIALYSVGFAVMFVKVNQFKVEDEKLAVHLAGVFLASVLASVLWPLIVLGWVFVALSYPDSE